MQGLFYAFGWGLLKVVLLARFHFDPLAGAIVVALSSIASLSFLILLDRYAQKVNEKKIFVSVAIGTGLSLFAAVGDIGRLGLIVILVLYAGSKVLTPYMSEALNLRVQSKQRATVLSVASFLSTLPYIFLAPIIGHLNSQGKLEYFLIFWGAITFVAVFVYLKLKMRDVQLRTVSPV